MIKRMWKKKSSKRSDGSSSDLEKWKDCTDALMTVEELPNWDGLLSLDCTPFGELKMLITYFKKQLGTFPAIAEYVRSVICFCA